MVFGFYIFEYMYVMAFILIAGGMHSLMIFTSSCKRLTVGHHWVVVVLQ